MENLNERKHEMKKDWMIKESELDDDQITVLNSTLEKSCVVSGCAGSGKSVLALIKAQRIQQKFGNNYQVIVFTKALCRYMNAGRTELGLKNDFVYHWKWQNKLHKKHSDYIVVDEIQDFTRDEVLEFVNAAEKGFFFFGDTAQSVYAGLKDTIRVDDVQSLPRGRKELRKFDLYRNYRLPLPVARLAHKIGVDLDEFCESTYKSTETEMPRVIRYGTQEAQLDAIHRIISEKGLTDVGILLPHNDKVKDVADALCKRGGNYEARYNDRSNFRDSADNLDFNSTNPKVMTYHSAKGLQFETVFLPFLEDVFIRNPDDRKPLYVAMTRTYRNLYVMYSGRLPTVLQPIDHALYKTSETDEVDDI